MYKFLKTMKKFTFSLTFIMFFSVYLLAQDDDFYSLDSSEQDNKKENPEPGALARWNFGGSIWLSFTSHTRYFEIAPAALYRITSRFHAGPGFKYTYYKDVPTNLTFPRYGLKAISRFMLLQDLEEMIPFLNIGDIQVYTEYEFLNLEKLYVDNQILYTEGRGWINKWLIGGGIYYPVGERGGGLSFLVLYDIIQDTYSPYNVPEFRVEIYF